MRASGGLLGLALLLAGCGAQGDGAPAQSLGDGDGEATLTGVVVDGSITPLAGAYVVVTGPSFQGNHTTDETGEFSFSGLSAGAYFIRASKATYSSVQQSVQVTEQGVSTPVRVVLEARPELVPYYRGQTWEGYIECSIRVGTGPIGTSIGVNACNDVGEQDVEFIHALDSTTATLFQAELTWQSSQALGSGLSFVAGPPDCADVDYARQDGPNPLLHRFFKPDLAAFVITTDGLCFRVFTYTSEESQHFAGVVVAQDFEGFFHQFYNYLPPAQWQFSVDGAPPDPPVP
jgi:hypothetical protein